MKAIFRSLRLAFGDRDPKTIRVADLGALEGGYGVECARAGYNTLLIEGRQENFDRCLYVADRLALPNLDLVLDDARNLRDHGRFDAVLCLGLLYHMDRPAEFLRTIGAQTNRLLLVQTHYAPEDESTVGPFRLGPLATNEGQRGRWLAEGIDQWSAVGNNQSFWLTRDHLFHSIQDAGFPAVYEQRDFLGHQVEDDYIRRWSRSLFMGVKD